MAWSFQSFTSYLDPFWSGKDRHQLPGRHKIFDHDQNFHIARARWSQCTSQSTQELIKNDIFVAVTELQCLKRTTSALKVAPIARAFRPIPKTILLRCFHLLRDCLLLGMLQTTSMGTQHSLDGRWRALPSRYRHSRCAFFALLMIGRRLRNDYPRCD